MTARDTNDRKRFWIWAVSVILIMTLIGLTWGYVSERAFGAEPQTSTSMPNDETTAQRCCQALAKTAARKFRDGKIRRDHGYKPRNIYRRPGVARKVRINKIARYLENHPNQWRQVKQRMPDRLRSCYPASECYGSELYDNSVDRSSCVTGSYPAAGQGACDRAPWHNGPGLTKRQVQVGGSVILCGAGVALAVATAPETAGSSTVAFTAFLGAVTCGWGLWVQVDSGGGESWRTVA